jgi:hypothetical protein
MVWTARHQLAHLVRCVVRLRDGNRVLPPYPAVIDSTELASVPAVGMITYSAAEI